MVGRYLPSFFRSFVFLAFLTSLDVWPQHLVPQDDVQAPGVSAKTFLSQRLPLWQRRLHLEDWKIEIVFMEAGQLKPATLGNIHWDADHKNAVIRVLHPADYRLPHNAMLQDMEFTVVHELIHLDLSSLPRSQASRRDEEFAVNRIAEALLNLDRQQPPLLRR